MGTFKMPTPKARAGEPAESGGFTHDVFVDRSGVAWITGEDGTFGYTTADPLKPELVYRRDENVANSGNSGPTSPETAEDQPARLPAPQLHAHGADHLRRGPGDDRARSARPRRLRQRDGGHRGGLHPSRLPGPGLIPDLADHRRAQLGRHGQAEAAGPVDHRADRARLAGGTLPGHGQLLGALVRRGPAGWWPRAGTTRACASWTSPTPGRSARWATGPPRAASGPRTSLPPTPSARSSTASTRPAGSTCSASTAEQAPATVEAPTEGLGQSANGRYRAHSVFGMACPLPR